MDVKYIEKGRFPHPTIWVKIEDKDTLIKYVDSQAFDIGKALDLWKGLTDALVEAGQAGMLDTGLRESIAGRE
jgi:hypothetical protein